jgi:hypothetical protein
MGKSFDPMLKEKAGSGSRAHSRRSSASMSLQSAIPRRVALQQCTPLLHRLQSACDRLTLQVNSYGNDGNIGEPINFNCPPKAQAAKQKTDLPLKNRRRLSEQPGPPHTAQRVLLNFDSSTLQPVRHFNFAATAARDLTLTPASPRQESSPRVNPSQPGQLRPLHCSPL